MRERSAAMWQDSLNPGDLHDWLDNYQKHLLDNSNLPRSLWPELACHAIWLKNRSPFSALVEKVTSWNAKNGVIPDLRNERVWGSPAYPIIPWDKRRGAHHSKLLERRATMGKTIIACISYPYA